jgi:hypothetical protein
MKYLQNLSLSNLKIGFAVDYNNRALIKKKKMFLIYKEIQMGLGAKSYMRKGFLIYEEIFISVAEHFCAADFSLLNLPKGKSLGRSKPATNS